MRNKAYPTKNARNEEYMSIVGLKTVHFIHPKKSKTKSAMGRDRRPQVGKSLAV
jgi:hypothetical protein